MSNLERIKVRATIGDIEEFKESIVWKDIKQELRAWAKGFEIEQKTIADNVATENPSTAAVLIHLGDINGRTKAVEYLISIPDIFIQILEDDKETKEED